MMQLLREAASREIMPRQGLPTYTGKLLAAFEAEKQKGENKPGLPLPNPLSSLRIDQQKARWSSL